MRKVKIVVVALVLFCCAVAAGYVLTPEPAQAATCCVVCQSYCWIELVNLYGFPSEGHPDICVPMVQGLCADPRWLTCGCNEW